MYFDETVARTMRHHVTCESVVNLLPGHVGRGSRRRDHDTDSAEGPDAVAGSLRQKRIDIS